MTPPVFRLLNPRADELIVLDTQRRLYVGLNRKGDGWHVVQPVRIDDPRVGDGKRAAGQLVCTCESGSIRGTCYRTDQAEALEAGMAQSIPGDNVPLVELFG